MSMLVSEHEQGTPGWHLDRAGVVTSSVFCQATGQGRGGKKSLTRLTYMRKLANEIIRKAANPEGAKSFSMKRGNAMEPEARDYYAIVTGQRVKQSGLIYLNELKRIGASVDGLVGANGLVEIKNPDLATHIGYILDNCVPAEYVKQIQGQLWVTKREWCDFISYCPDAFKQGFIFRAYRDEKIIKSLSEDVYSFIGELDAMVMKLEAML